MTAIPLLAAGQLEIESACGSDPDWSCREVFELTGNEALADIAEFTVGKPLGIVLILIAGWLLVRLSGRTIDATIAELAAARARQRLAAARAMGPEALRVAEAGEGARAAQRGEAISQVLRHGTELIIWTIAGLLVLSRFDLDLAPLLAGAGVIGVAIGFGAQSLVKDFFSGMFILIEDQFAVGDVVDLGEATGKVEELSLRTTRLRAVDGTVWHVPNGEIIRVGNMSQNWSRALLDVEVGYETDLAQAQQVIKRVADELASSEADILEEPEVWGVEALGASGITIRLVVKTKPSEQWRISRELRRRIKLALDGAGIEIPFPQQTVWHRATAGAEPAAEPGG